MIIIIRSMINRTVICIMSEKNDNERKYSQVGLYNYILQEKTQLNIGSTFFIRGKVLYFRDIHGLKNEIFVSNLCFIKNISVLEF